MEYCAISDGWVERNEKDYPGKAVLYNCDGDLLFLFDEVWTDEQILTALSFANKAYGIGRASGARLKALEIRRALEMTG